MNAWELFGNACALYVLCRAPFAARAAWRRWQDKRYRERQLAEALAFDERHGRHVADRLLAELEATGEPTVH